MTKDEIIDYVLNSPENTNPNVLKGMLDQLNNGGSDSGGFEFVTVDFNVNTSDTFHCDVGNGFFIVIPGEKGIDYSTEQNFELTFDSIHGTAQLNIPIVHSEEVTNILTISWKDNLTLTNIITSDGIIKGYEESSLVDFILNGPGSISFSVSFDDDNSGDNDGDK